jgi:predicted transcriptional regulator
MDQRTQVRRAADNAEIARLYLQQNTQADIARQLDMTRAMVSRALKEIRQEWLTQAVYDFNQRQAMELARIDTLEGEYWKGWERSQEEQVVETETEQASELGELNLNKRTLQRAKRDGTVVFLQGIQWCIDQRCKILGLHAPKELRIEQHDVKTQDIAEMTTEQLRSIVTRHQARTAVDAQIVEEKQQDEAYKALPDKG